MSEVVDDLSDNYIDDRDESFFDPQLPQPITPKAVPASNPPKRVTRMTAAELSRTEFPEVNFVIPNLIPPGLTLLASSPKIGKSWMVLHFGDAVSSGGKVFGEYECNPGSVLYLALEDNLRRMKDRLSKLGTSSSNDFVIETERLKGKAGLTYIENWLKTHLSPKLIIIDTFGRFRGETKKNQGVYDSDTDALAPLQNIASQHNLAIILVHHTKKGATEDFTESVSGSRGLTGVADTIIKLDRKRGENDATLEITGRDIEEQEIGLRFDNHTGLWCLSDKTPQMIHASDEQKRVIELLTTIAENSKRDSSGGGRDSCAIVPPIIASYLGKNIEATWNLLKRMKQAGIIEQIGGKGSGYVLSESRLKW